MSRIYVVTGSASGIGRATCERLEHDGHRVLDVDLRDASIVADLSSPEGRATMIDDVARASGGVLDGVIANAGTTASEDLCIKVNYFGAVATLEGLRPLLERSPAPRAVATASSSVLLDNDHATVEACLAGDEAAAVAAAAGTGLAAYPSSKRAIARWIRQQAPTAAWAGAGIGLNAIAPGVVRTPMTDPILADPAMVDLIEGAVPMPFGGFAEPQHVAQLIAFLTAAETERITGQVVFIDGGADTVLRGDDIW